MGKTNLMNLQDTFLNAVRKARIPVTIHVTNGYQINNVLIVSFDSYAILAENDGKQLLVYKHAISTITPQHRVALSPKKEGGEA